MSLAQNHSSNYLIVKQELENMLSKYGGNQTKEFFMHLLAQAPFILGFIAGYLYLYDKPFYLEYVYLLVFALVICSACCCYFLISFLNKREKASKAFLENEKPHLDELSKKYGFTYATQENPTRTLLILRFGSEKLTVNLFLGSVS